MGKNLPGLKRGFHYDYDAKDLGIYVDGVQVESYSDVAARNYYVNNITGSSTGNGRSWGSPYAQPSEAIAAVVARQDAAVTGNEYIRDTIIIQGTSTAYEPLTTIAGYTNYVGIGADPSGLGGGIARIDGEGTAAACATSGTTIRGWDLYNLQFMQSVDGAVYGLDIEGATYRSKIEHCGFCNNGLAGIHIKSCGSLIIDDCKIVMDQFWTDYGVLVGSTSESTGNFNSCTIKNSYFTGIITAFKNFNTSGGGTWIHNCSFIGGTHGFQDLTPAGIPAVDYLHCSNCYGYGTHSSTVNEGGIEVTEAPGKRFYKCVDNADGTLYAYPSMDLEA